MRKVEGLSQRDVALRMGISEGAVEKQITKGIRLLATELFSGHAHPEDAINDSTELPHGKQHRD
jgi:RNA polymerase sigma-70 factor (ECF subfamily)